MKVNALPITSQEYCINFVKSGDDYLIKDDTFFKNICEDGYVDAVYQISQILGQGVTLGK
jgi:hypothetical protein